MALRICCKNIVDIVFLDKICVRVLDGLRKNVFEKEWFGHFKGTWPPWHRRERKRDRRVTELVIWWIQSVTKLYPLYPWTLLTNPGPLTNFLTPHPFINPCTIISPIINPSTTHTAHYTQLIQTPNITSPFHSTLPRKRKLQLV